jgi:hypothetical protein
MSDESDPPRYISMATAIARYATARSVLYDFLRREYFQAIKRGRRTLIDRISADVFFANCPKYQSGQQKIGRRPSTPLLEGPEPLVDGLKAWPNLRLVCIADLEAYVRRWVKLGE